MDTDAFRDAVESAVVESDVEPGTMARVLEAQTAALRGQVRFPLDVSPAEAETLREELDDRVGDTMELEIAVTEALLDGLDVQLAAVGEGDAEP